MAQQDLIKAAQERGINMSQADDETWHGSFIHDGQEYTLDADTVEELSDDMHALADIMQQDDTYSVDYNGDLDRYVVEVQGFDEPFSEQTLAKAFPRAKQAYMDKMAKQEEERKAREPSLKPARCAQAARQEAAATVPASAEPARQPRKRRLRSASRQPCRRAASLPEPVAEAMVRFLDALTEKLRGPSPGTLPAAPPQPSIRPSSWRRPSISVDPAKGPTPPMPPAPKKPAAGPVEVLIFRDRERIFTLSNSYSKGNSMARPIVPDSLKARTVPLRLTKPQYRALSALTEIMGDTIQELLRNGATMDRSKPSARSCSRRRSSSRANTGSAR